MVAVLVFHVHASRALADRTNVFRSRRAGQSFIT
jgi:hypothetical protein